MTKNELIAKYNELTKIQKVTLEGIGANSNKADLESAISCLECSDETMNDYLTVVKLKWPNMHKAITANGDFKKHHYNRYHVYISARVALGIN